MPSQTPGLLVVAGAVVDDLTRPTRVLSARRTAPARLAGRWELPGGKVEAGEAPTAALHREMAEELGVGVRLGRPLQGPLCGAWPLTPGARMLVWWAQVRTGEARPLQDHDDLRWLTRATLGDVPWLPTNTALLAALASTMRDC